MKNKLRFEKLLILICITLIFVSLLSGSSCILFNHSDSSYTPEAVSDGAGGAIVVYEKVKSGTNREFYAQRISPDGKPLWGVTGTLIDSSQANSYSFPVFDIVSDGTGGAIIAWPDLAPDQFQSIKYVTKIDSNGGVIWTKTCDYFEEMISDGGGGAIIAFDDSAGNSGNNAPIVVIRIDSGGNYPWGQQGVQIRHLGNWPTGLQMVSDGANGTIAVWGEMEAQAGTTTPSFQYTSRIMAQRVNAEGNLSWGVNGITVCANPENVVVQEPCAAADGSGGAIVCWQQNPSGPIDNSSPLWDMQDIITQKIDSEGNILWQPGGVPLQIVKTAEEASPFTPLAIGDDSGGAIVMWEDLRSGLASIYAQKMDSNGASAWQTGGIKVIFVKSNSSNERRQIVGDGTGGAVISCIFKEAGTGKQGVIVQKLDSAGNTAWADNGVAVVTGTPTNYCLAADNHGGVLLSWGVGAGSSEKSYIQDISSGGSLQWGNGIRLDR
ncbi:MAG TPA: hypothetical protein VJ280_08010 [Dehalococcoidales bacterium]|nr:hypothetical protein [Dehalococcoidales bacterium]